MLIPRFIQIFGIVAFASINFTVAAPSGHKHVLSKRATSTYCDQSDLEAISFAVNEMQQMVRICLPRALSSKKLTSFKLSVAISRTASLKAFLQNPGNLNDQDIKLQSTFYTFESIFGQLFYGEKDDRNAAAAGRVIIIESKYPLLSPLTGGMRILTALCAFP